MRWTGARFEMGDSRRKGDIGVIHAIIAIQQVSLNTRASLGVSRELRKAQYMTVCSLSTRESTLRIGSARIVGRPSGAAMGRGKNASQNVNGDRYIELLSVMVLLS